jgi:hypothetical protein
MRAHRILPLAIVFASACVNTVEDEMDYFEPQDDGDNLLFQGVYDCTESREDGYRQGNRFTITVVRVDGRPVEVNTANAYIAMQNAARAAGVNLRIVSGFRTMSQQQYLYGCYTNCNCNNCNLAARPGYSNHQSGHALDLNTSEAGVLNWLNNNGSRFGFRRTVPSENWHWEWWGNASDFNGPCGVTAPPPPPQSSSGAPADCEALPAAGGVIDDGDNCFVPGGPTQTLRAIDSGYDGDLIWTYATALDRTYNYAEWWLKVSEPGRYRVEVYVDANVSTSKQTAYSIRSALGESRVVVDQTTAGGFRNLGEVTLDPGQAGRVRVVDNTGEAGSQQRKIVFDAVRVTRIADATCSQVRVQTDGGPLNVRPSPSTDGAPRGTLANGKVVERISSTSGQTVRGVSTWHQIRDGSLTGWVSGAYTACQ